MEGNTVEDKMDDITGEDLDSDGDMQEDVEVLEGEIFEIDGSELEGEEGEEAEEGIDQSSIEPQEEEEEEEDNSSVAFVGHKDSIFSVSLHPDPSSSLVVTGGGDDVAFLWDTLTGQAVHQLAGHSDTVSSVAFNSDGKLIATGSYGATVKIWETSTGNLQQSLDGPGGDIDWVCWHPRGNVVLAGSQDCSAWMWLSNGTVMNVFAGHTAAVTCGAFTYDGKLVVTGSEDSTVRVWDPKSAQSIAHLQGHGFHEGPVVCMAIHSNNNLIATGSDDGTVKVSNINGKIIGSVGQHENTIETVGFSTTLPLLASGCLDTKLEIWDLNTLQLRVTCTHDDGIIRLKWHPTQPLVFTGSQDNTVRLWDARTGNCEKVWKGHRNHILDLDVKKDGSYVVTASDDHAALVFKLT